MLQYIFVIYYYRAAVRMRAAEGKQLKNERKTLNKTSETPAGSCNSDLGLLLCDYEEHYRQRTDLLSLSLQVSGRWSYTHSYLHKTL